MFVYRIVYVGFDGFLVSQTSLVKLLSRHVLDDAVKSRKI